MKRTKRYLDLEGMERDAQKAAREVKKKQNIKGLSRGIDSQTLRLLGKIQPSHRFSSKVSCASEVLSEYTRDILKEQRYNLEEQMASLMTTPSSHVSGQHQQEEDEESDSLFSVGDHEPSSSDMN